MSAYKTCSSTAEKKARTTERNIYLMNPYFLPVDVLTRKNNNIKVNIHAKNPKIDIFFILLTFPSS